MRGTNAGGKAPCSTVTCVSKSLQCINVMLGLWCLAYIQSGSPSSEICLLIDLIGDGK